MADSSYSVPPFLISMWEAFKLVNNKEDEDGGIDITFAQRFEKGLITLWFCSFSDSSPPGEMCVGYNESYSGIMSSTDWIGKEWMLDVNKSERIFSHTQSGIDLTREVHWLWLTGKQMMNHPDKEADETVF